MTDKKPTPKQALEAAVFQVDESQIARDDQAPLVGTWAVLCPITDGSCGSTAEDGTVTPFSSAGWPTKAIAKDRLAGHIAEHKGEAEGVSLEDFRAKHGLQQDADGQRAVFTAKDF